MIFSNSKKLKATVVKTVVTNELVNNIENYVNNIIKNFNLDETALQLTVTDRIDFIFGLPIRHDRKTISCNPVIEKEVWELLRDNYRDLALPL